MLYPHFQENYLPCSKFAIFLPANFSEEPNSLTYETGSVPVFYWKCGVSAVDGAKSLLTSTDSLASLKSYTGSFLLTHAGKVTSGFSESYNRIWCLRS